MNYLEEIKFLQPKINHAQENKRRHDIKDFKVWHVFKPDDSPNHDIWCDGTPYYIIDQDTGDKYLNEENWFIRFKCFLLVLSSPLVHTIAALFNGILKLKHLFDDIQATIIHLLLNQKVSKPLLQDLSLLILSVMAPVILTLAAVYGVFLPHNGRKLYASVERLLFGGPILAPCFQPMPEKHLFGSEMTKKNGL